MGQEAVFCNFCGRHIPPSDFQKGRAVVLLKRNYCSKCLAEAVRKSKEAPGPKKQESAPSAPAITSH